MFKERLLSQTFCTESQRTVCFSLLFNKRNVLSEETKQFFLSLVFYTKKSKLIPCEEAGKEFFFQAKNKEPSFLLRSDELSLPENCSFVRGTVSSKENFYSGTKINKFFLKTEKSEKELFLSIKNLENWNSYLRQKNSLSTQELFYLFKVFLFLGQNQTAFTLAKELEQAKKPESQNFYLEVKSFLDKEFFLLESKGKKIQKKENPQKKETKTNVYIQDSSALPDNISLHQKKGQEIIIIRTLGVSKEEKCSDIIKKNQFKTHRLYTKPFVSYDDLEFVNPKKRLQLDLNLSLRILRQLESPQIIQPKKDSNSYTKNLVHGLLKEL